jgi:multicomponent K+:H+ antiporter subunit D
MMDHWIIAPVVLPAFIGAMIVLIARHDQTLQRALSLIGAGALLAVALALIVAASNSPPEVYRLGNWPAPFGIVLVLDRLAALMLLLTAGLGVVVLLYVISTGWDSRGRHFHALFQFQLMGLGGAFLTGDAFNLFVFFEVLLIASYGLMIHDGGRDRLRAGVQYVALNLIGSTLFLFALATLYSVTGTLNMADMAVKVATLPEGDGALMRAAAVMLMLVFAIKGALVPLHFWLPGTYANAPGPVAALFAIMTKVGAYAILRTGTLIFPPDTAATGTMIADLLLPAALITLAIGALGVLGATTLPRLAALAAIASMGTLFIALSAFTPAATAAGLYYMIHSTLATAAIFLVADLVADRRADTRLVARPPIAQQGLIAALFFAPLSGFLGKLLILDALRGQAALIWTVILGTSFVMILGLSRAGSVLFWKSHESLTQPDPHRPEAMSFVAVGALLAGLVGLTIFAGPITGWLEATAATLHDTAPYIDANQLGTGG